MADSDLKAWVSDRLSMILGFESGEVADYILSMPVGTRKDETELRSYLVGFMGDTKEVRQLADDVIARRKNPPPRTGASGKKTSGGGDAGGGGGKGQVKGGVSTGTPKGSQDTEADFWGTSSTSFASSTLRPSTTPSLPQPPSQPSAPPPVTSSKASTSGGTGTDDFWGAGASQKPQAQSQTQGQKKGGGGGGSGKGTGKGGGAKGPKDPPSQQLEGRAVAAAGGGKKGPKAEQKPASPAVVLAPPLEPLKPKATCRCMGTTHKPLGNCLQCGKIACELEGWTSCTFCGIDLRVHGYQSGGGRGGARQKQSHHQTGTGEPAPAASAGAYGQTLEDAVALKEKLLMFDRTLAERSKVFDDQADYYSNSDWLSEEEKAAAAAKEEARRQAMDTRTRSVTIGIDLAGRRILHYDDDNPMPKLDEKRSCSGVVEDRVGAEVAAMIEEMSGGRKEKGGEQRMYENDGLTGRAREVYESLNKHFDKIKGRKASASGASDDRWDGVRSSGRVQYDEDPGVEETKGGAK